MSKPMMACGHAANATNGDGQPSCVICVGIDPGAEVVDTDPPDLSTRTARCAYGCGKQRPSVEAQTVEAFFEHRPDRETDSFYCDCRGWD